MSYRAHVVVHRIDSGSADPYVQRSHATALGRTALKSLTKDVVLGHVGSRYGVDGIWVEHQNRAHFEASVRMLSRFLESRGLFMVVHTTNIPSQQALQGLPFERKLDNGRRHPAVLQVQRG